MAYPQRSTLVVHEDIAGTYSWRTINLEQNHNEPLPAQPNEAGPHNMHIE